MQIRTGTKCRAGKRNLDSLPRTSHDRRCNVKVTFFGQKTRFTDVVNVHNNACHGLFEITRLGTQLIIGIIRYELNMWLFYQWLDPVGVSDNFVSQLTDYSNWQ